MAVSIKISKENYEWLCGMSGELRKKLHKPVSINEAITYLHRRGELSDIAGTWKMSDKETEELFKNLRKGWKRWIIRSV